jgi:hypothetical protein
MDKENNSGTMEHILKEFLIKVAKNLVNFNGLMEHHMKDNLIKINCKEKANLLIKITDIILVNGNKI